MRKISSGKDRDKEKSKEKEEMGEKKEKGEEEGDEGEEDGPPTPSPSPSTPRNPNSAPLHCSSDDDDFLAKFLDSDISADKLIEEEKFSRKSSYKNAISYESVEIGGRSESKDSEPKLTSPKLNRMFGNELEVLDFTISILGGAAVGKTSLLSRFLQDDFEQSCEATLTPEYHHTDRRILNKLYHLTLIDTAGQEQFVLQREEVIKASQAFIIVYDVTQTIGLEESDGIVSEICREKSKEPYLLPILLLANKCDCEPTDRKIFVQDGEAFAKKNGILFEEVSAATGSGVKAAFSAILERLGSPVVSKAPVIPVMRSSFGNRISLPNVMSKIQTLPLQKKSRRFNSNLYFQCCTGKTIVKWMLSSDVGITSEVEAILMGELLLNANIMVPLQRNPEFSSSAKSIYALTEGIVPISKPSSVLSPRKERKINLASRFTNMWSSHDNVLIRSHDSKSTMKEEEGTNLFGATLEEVMALQAPLYPHLKVPLIIHTLTSAVIQYGGQETEGIFRVPGKNTEISRLKAQFDSGDYSISTTDPNDLGGCLKMWFRELKNPLIPNHLYEECINASQESTTECYELIKQIPELHLYVADAMLAFLVDMAKHSDQTKMHAANLAMVFAPGFFGMNDPVRMVLNATKEGKFIENLIHEYQPDTLIPDSSST